MAFFVIYIQTYIVSTVVCFLQVLNEMLDNPQWYGTKRVIRAASQG